MRVYVATTPELIKQLLAGDVTFEDYLTPEQFEFDAGVDEEEREHLVSLLAADDSIELNQGRAGFVLAADLNDDQLNGEPITLNFQQIAALLYSVDGEELSWFAPEEIEHQIGGLI
jgi:hypothetical protein